MIRPTTPTEGLWTHRLQRTRNELLNLHAEQGIQYCGTIQLP